MLDKSTIATEASRFLHPDDNNTRDGLKTQARVVVNEMMSSRDKADYKNQTGMSINRTIDMVSREVLIACIASALDDAFNDFLIKLTEAMQDDSVCMPKQRGSGVSRGYHKGFRQRIVNEDIINQHAGGKMPATYTNIISVSQAADAIIHACNIWLDTGREFKPNFSEVSDVVFGNDLQFPLEGGDYNELSGELADRFRQGEHSPVGIDLDDMTEDQQALCQNVVEAMATAWKGRDPAPTSQSTVPEPAVLDPNLAPAVDALLKQATNGAVGSISQILKDNHDARAEKSALEAELEQLRNASFQSKPTQAVGTIGELSYEVVMQKASDLFTDKRGRKSSKLDFDVVTLKWTDTNGNVVRHPMCPEVDETYQFRMWHLIKFLSAMKFGQNVWLHGHTGTGKTTLAMQIAARLGIPVERLNLDSNIERADMVGATEIVVKDGAPTTEFREGILPKAMQQPCWFVLDELDAGRPDALFAIQRVLEGNGLTMTEQAGKVVEPHELFRIVATANSRGQGDEHGWYAGVRPMNLAMLNRFGAFIEVPYLDKDDEVELLKRAYPALKPKERDEMAGYAELVREAFQSGEVSQTISPRNIHSMAMYFLHYKGLMPEREAMHEAVKTTVIDSAPADNAQRLEELYQRVFGVV